MSRKSKKNNSQGQAAKQPARANAKLPEMRTVIAICILLAAMVWTVLAGRFGMNSSITMTTSTCSRILM